MNAADIDGLQHAINASSTDLVAQTRRSTPSFNRVPSGSRYGSRDRDHSVMGLVAAAIGDFNADRIVGVDDLDLLSDTIRTGLQEKRFDLNISGSVTQDDLQFMVQKTLVTWFGDANLDGEFNTGDLVQVLGAGKYETQETAGWSEGD